MGKYQLSINYWFLIIFLLIQTGLNELGFWQLSRAQEKQQRLKILANNDTTPITNLDSLSEESISKFVQVSLQVRLLKNKNIIIENKIQNGELGYHVLNIVEDEASGRRLLINRGWIEAKANRSDLPVVVLPPKSWQLEARIYSVNQDVLSQKAELEVFDKIIRLPVLDRHMLTLLEKQFNVKLETYLLRLQDENIAAFKVDWAWVSMLPEKHLGYAFQWFALSLAFLIVSLFALIKKK